MQTAVLVGESGLEEQGTCLIIHSREKLSERVDARFGKLARGIKTNFCWQIGQASAKDSDDLRELREPGIPAYFADIAQDADCAELFEDVRITQDNGLDDCGVVSGLMRSNCFEDSGNFLRRKVSASQNLWDMLAGIGDVIPFGKLFGIFGTMTDEDSEIMKPGRRVDDIIVIVQTCANLLCQSIEPWLVPVFVYWTGIVLDKLRDGIAKIWQHKSSLAEEFQRAVLPRMERDVHLNPARLKRTEIVEI